MSSSTKPRVPGLLPDQTSLKAVLCLTVLGFWSGVSAGADQPASGTPPADRSRSAQSGQVPADEDLIEFLGADDVGDAAWWEFLKKSAPRKDDGSDSQPQGGKQ